MVAKRIIDLSEMKKLMIVDYQLKIVNTATLMITSLFGQEVEQETAQELTNTDRPASAAGRPPSTFVTSPPERLLTPKPTKSIVLIIILLPLSTPSRELFHNHPTPFGELSLAEPARLLPFSFLPRHPVPPEPRDGCRLGPPIYTRGVLETPVDNPTLSCKTLDF